MKKNKVIIPAMALILFSTAASISGTVAWFTASRVFNTEVGNFQVVEIDGSLDVKMAPGEGTIKKGDNGIKVREATDDYFVGSALVAGSFVSGDEPADKTSGKLWFNGTVMKQADGSDYDADAALTVGGIYRNAVEGKYYVALTGGKTIQAIGAVGGNFKSGEMPASNTENDLWFNGSTMQKCTTTGTPGSFGDAALTVGSIYHDTIGNADYVAVDGTHIQPVSKNAAVLTHGSVDHTGTNNTNEGRAYVIDADDTSSFIDRGNAVTDNWIQRANVVLKDKTPADQTVDVYNAVSWTMTFSYSFSSDTSPVGVYLDLAKSEFIDVATPTPDFTKDATKSGETSKGFRIGFYDESTAHDVVWGNNVPLTAAPAAYANATAYAKGAVVRNSDGKIYKAKAAIASSAATLVADQWEQIGELPAYATSGVAYKVGDRVLQDGKVFQCKEAIAADAGSFNNTKWEDLTPAAYNPLETYAEGEKAINDGKVYKCTKSGGITVAEAWTPANWTETNDVKLDATAEFSTSSAYAAGAIVKYNHQTYKAKESIVAGAWDSSKWERCDETADLRYVSGTSETTLYTASDYVTTDHGYKRLENLNANETQAWAAGNAAERVCTLTTANPSVTIKCAAWFEGTDPNVVTGAAMECLKANMTFYARTVNA